MPNFDLDALETDGNVDWPKRGRKASAIPEKLANALHQSFSHHVTPHMVVAENQVAQFRRLLDKAGRQLNYRIEHNVVDIEDKPGYKMYYFRTKAHRRRETANG